MKRLVRVIFPALMAFCALYLTLAGQTQDPAVALQRAIQLETVDGDLSAAIEQYKQIVQRNGGNRSVAAQALFRLGGCYEKLGQADARKAYQQLVDAYPEQQQEVAAARQRLTVLGQQAAGVQKPRFRKIQVPTKLSQSGSGKLSPDGQTLASVSDGSLWVMPVHGKSDPDIAGAPVRLTPPMNADDSANIGIEWSGNGKWIAFRVAVPRPNRNAESEMYIIPAEGGTPKRLPISWKDWADDVYTLRYSLSAEAETVYFAAGTKHDDLRIYSMPASGGEWRPVTQPTTRQPALSPDGSKIAFVKMESEGNPNPVHTKEIWVAPAGGGEGNRVYRRTETALGWVQSPVWSPDGRFLAFLASESGNRHRQVFVLPVRNDGSTGGEVAKFDLPSGTADVLAGWTKDNRLGILIPSEQQTALYTVPAAGGKAARLTTKYAAIPNWTPDGKAIYFDGAHDGEWAAIEFIPAAGGEVTRVPIDKEFEFLQPSYPLGGISLSPDGKTICFAGFYRRGGTPGSAIYLLPKDGGRPERLTTNAMGDVEPTWSPDGRQIAFIRREHAAGDQVMANIYVVPRDGGQPRRITTPDDKVQLASLDWSPDGELIAFYGRDNEKEPSPCLRVIPSKGGHSQILVPRVTPAGLTWAGLSWSPDGKALAYVSEAVLWRIPREGGVPSKIQTGLDDARMAKIDWSPDGRTIALEATKGGDHELWLMEDFLSLIAKAQ